MPVWVSHSLYLWFSPLLWGLFPPVLDLIRTRVDAPFPLGLCFLHSFPVGLDVFSTFPPEAWVWVDQSCCSLFLSQVIGLNLLPLVCESCASAHPPSLRPWLAGSILISSFPWVSVLLFDPVFSHSFRVPVFRISEEGLIPVVFLLFIHMAFQVIFFLFKWWDGELNLVCVFFFDAVLIHQFPPLRASSRLRKFPSQVPPERGPMFSEPSGPLDPPPPFLFSVGVFMLLFFCSPHVLCRR